jgi:hypothetical protein
VRPVLCRFGTTAASLAEGRRSTEETQRGRDPKAAEDWPHSKTLARYQKRCEGPRGFGEKLEAEGPVSWGFGSAAWTLPGGGIV